MTAGILTFGLLTMAKGNAGLSQRVMRARVVAQGVTIAFVGLGSVGFTFFMPKKKAAVVDASPPPPPAQN